MFPQNCVSPSSDSQVLVLRGLQWTTLGGCFPSRVFWLDSLGCPGLRAFTLAVLTVCTLWLRSAYRPLLGLIFNITPKSSPQRPPLTMLLKAAPGLPLTLTLWNYLIYGFSVCLPARVPDWWWRGFGVLTARPWQQHQSWPAVGAPYVFVELEIESTWANAGFADSDQRGEENSLEGKSWLSVFFLVLSSQVLRAGP